MTIVTIYLLVLFTQNPKADYADIEYTAKAYKTQAECEEQRIRFHGMDIECIGETVFEKDADRPYHQNRWF